MLLPDYYVSIHKNPLIKLRDSLWHTDNNHFIFLEYCNKRKENNVLIKDNYSSKLAQFILTRYYHISWKFANDNKNFYDYVRRLYETTFLVHGPWWPI